MVNAKPTTGPEERRERPRAQAPTPAALGLANPNPFGDLHTLQHLTARLARAFKPGAEQLLGTEARTWAEPLSVERFGDYQSERGTATAAWLALDCGHEAQALAVFDAALVGGVLDAFFGGSGAAAKPLDAFTPTALALVEQVGETLAPLLTAAWEPVTPLNFRAGAVETATANLKLEADDIVVLARLGFARDEAEPRFIDILYPLALLKPHQESITRKVHSRTPDAAPAWRQALTRAVMDVPLPVRTVLAEPVMPLARLLELKVGDVIPIGVGHPIPVMVGAEAIGFGTVGTVRGKAAIQLNEMALLEGPQR